MIALEAFKINKVDGIPILTLLVESLNARNAHWVKEEVLYFIKSQKPRGLFINLNNVVHIGHIGLGTLIAINNQIRTLQPHAFVCLGAEVQSMVDASHLEKIFQIWTPAQPCLICQQAQCRHKAELQQKFAEFPSRNYPIDESKIPHLGEKTEHALDAAPAPPPARPASLRPAPEESDLELDSEAVKPARSISSRRLNLFGIAAIALVLVGVIVTVTWLTAVKFATTGFTRFTPLNTEVRVDEYDMDGDGNLSPADLPQMSDTQRTNLSFTPYCAQLGLACKSPE